MASEIELKLDVSPDAANAIEDSLEGCAEVVQQRSTYFDTSYRTLFKAGLTLRIRQAGKSNVQTVKASGGSAAGLFTRDEWERPVEGEMPVLDDTTPIRAILGEVADKIEPLFEVCVERHIRIVRHGDTLIELVIDRGEVIAADRTAPITEIELELKEGTPSSLFAFARSLEAEAPVRPGVLSKSERGYRLFEEARTDFKAEPVALTAGMTAAEAFQHIVYGCVRQFRLNEEMLSSGRHSGALHEARVALRRLRSAFAIFRSIARGAEADRLKGELRGLATELAEARNLDVLLDRTEAEPLRSRIVVAREDAYTHVEAVLAAPRVRALMLDLLEWTAAGEWLDAAETKADRCKAVRAHAEFALDHFRRKVKKDGCNLAHAADEARHEVRKDAKKLRYASEFFRSLFEHKRERRRFKRFIAVLEGLQDQLGALNDLATAPDLLKKLDPDEALTEFWPATAAKARLIEAADEAHEELVDAKRFWR